MVDTLPSIAELETKPEIKARYVFTQAQIYRDKLEDPDRAVELFNEALDLNPSYLEAFERINKILTQQKNWKQLERSYRKMIHRIAGKGNADLEHTLWHQLGLIYRDRLQQTRRGDRGLQDGGDDQARTSRSMHQILAELYEVTERWDDAIDEQRADPRRRIRSAIDAVRGALSPVPAQAVLRRGLVPGRGDGLPARRPTRRSSASSRTTGRRACCR